MFDFSNGKAMERDMQKGEICVARIPNTEPLGFTHHVAIVYKDDLGYVYSVGMNQHHGELKDTKENSEYGGRAVQKRNEEYEKAIDNVIGIQPPITDFKGRKK